MGAASGDGVDDELGAAQVIRRQVLGDAYVDGDEPDELRDHITRQAWGVWARGGPLTTRDRSLLVMGMVAAMGRMDEFELHVGASGRAGVTDAEIDELLFQIAAYCGAPAAVAARRRVRAVRDARA